MVRRALLTPHEREALRGNESGNARRVAASRVRKRLREQLPADVKILREHDREHGTDLVELLRDPLEDQPELPTRDGGETSRTEPTTPKRSESGPVGEPSEREATDRSARGVVDQVAEDWERDSRFENRREAAILVLTHALESEEGVGRSSDIVGEAMERFPVEGQNRETYYRKNLRPVLSEVGEYSRGTGKYTVRDLDRE
jgi:hypothetical protein